jgi:type IV pilus assembly protein PilA
MHARAFIPLRRMRGMYQFGPLVSLIGILAAIAIPAYHDYTLRSRVTEGLNLASAVKAAVAEYYATNDKWPRDLRELQFEQAPRGKYVTFVAVNHGTIVIRFSRAAGPQLDHQHLTLRPTISAQGDVIWNCGYGMEQGEDPSSGAASPHATTLAVKYLPRSCRG